MMTPQEIAAIISIARRAPLTNMAEAEALSMLMQKLAAEYAPPPKATSPPAFTSPYGTTLE